MRTFTTLLAVAVAVALAPAPAPAEEVEALRKELEQMRKQFEAVQQQYRQAIDQLSQRLQRLERRPEPTATAPAPAGPPGAGPAPGGPPPPSAADLLRPREPFALAPQRGPGQLLFDMGVAGDLVASLTQRNVDRADAGTFAGRENRFFPREIELNLFGQVDPYANAYVRIEAGEEAPGPETEVSLAEAALTLLTLPYGTRLTLGQVRTRFGYSNEIHEHDLPWIDRPAVLVRFLGEEGLVEKGAELTWVPDLPFYVEALLGVFNGDNETAFGRGTLRSPLVTGRLRTFVELTDTSALQIGASAAHGTTGERLPSTLVGYDLRYKYRPDGWLHPLVTFGSEGLYAVRRVEVGADVPVDTDGDGLADAVETRRRERTRERSGWYAYAELQPFRRWAGGLRYDATELPVAPGREWALEPYFTFWPSEFLRFRLAYKHTERDRRGLFDPDGGGGRVVDELLLQATFILGAHPAHPF